MQEWAKKFYNGEAWRETSRAFLISKNGLCERCLARGEVVPAKIAHHKTYLNRRNINNPDIAYNWENLEALCQDCHNKEHHKASANLRFRFDAEGRLSPPIQHNNGEAEHRGGEVHFIPQSRAWGCGSQKQNYRKNYRKEA